LDFTNKEIQGSDENIDDTSNGYQDTVNDIAEFRNDSAKIENQAYPTVQPQSEEFSNERKEFRVLTTKNPDPEDEISEVVRSRPEYNNEDKPLSALKRLQFPQDNIRQLQYLGENNGKMSHQESISKKEESTIAQDQFRDQEPLSEDEAQSQESTGISTNRESTTTGATTAPLITGYVSEITETTRRRFKYVTKRPRTER
uniref:Conjugal transfer protein TraG n=1 Tax=Gongylonema pulchrum TaxID=637853 RepID=A0A183D6J5_9BILA